MFSIDKISDHVVRKVYTTCEKTYLLFTQTPPVLLRYVFF